MLTAPTYYKIARLHRELDRPKCSNPEIAVIGVGDEIITIASKLRRAGIATKTYGHRPLRRQQQAAISDDADFLLFADTMKVREVVRGTEWYFTDLLPSAVFAVNCAYLPLDLTWPDRFEGGV